MTKYSKIKAYCYWEIDSISLSIKFDKEPDRHFDMSRNMSFGLVQDLLEAIARYDDLEANMAPERMQND